MSGTQENTAIQDKQPVRKRRFGIVLKLSLFVVIIQLIVLIVLGFVFVEKEEQTLKSNIHLQVSSMMNSFRSRIARISKDFDDKILKSMKNSGEEKKTGSKLDLSSGDIIPGLNNILKNYTSDYSTEQSDSEKFKVSEIMVIDENGWIVNHSRDDIWQMQNHPSVKLPQSEQIDITNKDLNKFSKIIFDDVSKMKTKLYNKTVNGVNYFETAYPIYVNDKKKFLNIPSLINAVDNFKLIYDNFRKQKYFNEFTQSEIIFNALKSFDMLLNELYLYVKLTPENSGPAKLTDYAKAMLKTRLFNRTHFNYFKRVSDMIVKYVRRKWFYSNIFREDFNDIFSKIQSTINKKSIAKFAEEVKPILSGKIKDIEESLNKGEYDKAKKQINVFLQIIEKKFTQLTAKFPSVEKMNSIENKIRVFTKNIGEKGVYVAGIEPWNKYFKPFRDFVSSALSRFETQDKPDENKKIKIDKSQVLKDLKNAFLVITEKDPNKIPRNIKRKNSLVPIPFILEQRVLKPIKITFEDFANGKYINMKLVIWAAKFLKTVENRIKSYPSKTLKKIIETLSKELEGKPYLKQTHLYKKIAELRKIYVEKLRQEAEKKATQSPGIKQDKQKKKESNIKELQGWDFAVHWLENNEFFKKDLIIVGKKTQNSLTETELKSLPFYAMLFMVKQHWRIYTNYRHIPTLNKNFSKTHQKYYKYVSHRRKIVSILKTFVREDVYNYWWHREYIDVYPDKALRALYSFSVTDFAKLYPVKLQVENYIYSKNKAMQNQFWVKGLSGTDKIRVSESLIKKIASSMMNPSKIGYIVLRVRKNQYHTFLRKARNTTIDYSISILIRTVFLSVIFSSIFLKSLKTLSRGAEAIGRGEFQHRIVLSGSDEFGQLADTLNNMAVDVEAKLRMEGELNAAKIIQETLIPNSTPNIPGYSFAGFYQAQSETGGDYYDYLTDIGKGHLGLVVGDVSGHGVGAGIVMTMVRMVLHTTAIGVGRASTVVKKINPLIYRDTTPNMYATLWYGILNTDKKILNYTIAGHNPAVIWNPLKKKFVLLKTGGMPVGLQPSEIFDPVIESHVVQLEKGDILIQYTDGVTEAMNSEMEEYEEERFYKCIKRLGNVSAERVVQAIVDDIQKFTGGIPQSDDITMLVMKVEK